MTPRKAVQHAVVCLLAGAAVIFTGCRTAPVVLTFPDFPEGVAAIDLGEKLTIDVAAQNDGGAGVTWTCEGPACGKMTSTTKSATFTATTLTGKATITAISIKQPAVTKSIRVTVNLNDTPDLLCLNRMPEGVIPPAVRQFPAPAGRHG